MRKQMRRAVVSILLVVCMLALSGCGGQRMMMGTGGTAGTYYAFGGVLAQYMKNYTGYSVTDGSVYGCFKGKYTEYR